MFTVCVLLATMIIAQPTPIQKRTGSISGRILSPEGTPLSKLRVAAMVISNQAGKEEELAAITETDDDGYYELWDLTAGEYYIRAGLLEHPTYYPGVTHLAEAKIVVVTPAGRLIQIDFSMRTGLGVRLSGTIVWDVRQPLILVAPKVLLVRGTSEIAEVRPNSDGSYAFSKIPPGTYDVLVRGAAVAKDVIVDTQDVDQVQLIIPPSFPVAVRLVVEGAAIPDTPIALMLVGSFRQGVRRMLVANRSVSLLLRQDRYRVVVDSLPKGFKVRAITFGAVDLLNQPLVLGPNSSSDVVVNLQAN
jgi:hypothetical protein